jgi:hypothetical protein
MKDFMNQLKQVLRRLERAPMFTAITLITLAAGVGGNTVIFSVLEGVLLKPLPYPKAEELIGVWHTAPGINLKDLNAAPSNYFIYREQNQTLQAVGMYQGDSVSVTGMAEPEQVRALDVTQEVLPLLGITPAVGRWFSLEDDSPGILAAQIWRRQIRDWAKPHDGRKIAANYRRYAAELSFSGPARCLDHPAAKVGPQ